MYMSNYFANKLIDFIFRGQPYPQNLTLFIGLHQSLGEDGQEVDAGGYTRAPMVCSLAAWSGTQGVGTIEKSSGGSKFTTNNITIQFSAATEDWGSVVAIGIYDAEVNGNLLMYAALNDSVNILAGDDPATIEIANLRIQIDS
jgi:hypothetical protein